MGSINTRVVRRTQALLGTRFDYQEYSKFGSSRTARLSDCCRQGFRSIAASGSGAESSSGCCQNRARPSQKVMDGGFFECEFVATAKERQARARDSQGPRRCGQPHYSQVFMRVRVVLALSDAGNTAVKPFTGGGVLTPVTGLGEELIVRLAKAGILSKSFDHDLRVLRAVNNSCIDCAETHLRARPRHILTDDLR